MGSLPFRHNVTWPTVPEWELQVRTKSGTVSWLVRREDEKLFVVLPNFVHAPWSEPILEKRGKTPVFNAPKFAQELGKHLGLEFCSWSVFLKGLVQTRTGRGVWSALGSPFTRRESSSVHVFE